MADYIVVRPENTLELPSGLEFVYNTQEARRIHLLYMLQLAGYDTVANMLYELAVAEKCTKCGKRYWDHDIVC